jgi:hypothetical protein
MTNAHGGTQVDGWFLLVLFLRICCICSRPQLTPSRRRRSIDFAPQDYFYSITSSAMASKDGGTSTPISLAVWALMMNSNLVG